MFQICQWVVAKGSNWLLGTNLYAFIYPKKKKKKKKYKSSTPVLKTFLAYNKRDLLYAKLTGFAQRTPMLVFKMTSF